jgi:AAA domain/Primase C terminal 2 (PriCT-2)
MQDAQEGGREGRYAPTAQHSATSDQAYDVPRLEHNGSSDDCARSYPSTSATPIAAPTPESAIPAAMRSARRWLLHRDKRPFYVDGKPRGGTLDSPDDWARLGTYDQALQSLSTGTYSGLGFALGPDGTGNFWQGIDLDDVPANQLATLANELPSYVEMSPSGKGCHAIGYGRHFRALGSNGTGIEAYASGRYFTVTERPIRPFDVTDLADHVEQIITSLHGAPVPSKKVGEPAVAVDARTVSTLRSALAHMRSDDYDLWIRMGHALHELGETGRGLWIEWSQTSEKYNARETTKKWDGFNPQDTGYQAAFAEAQRQGWVNPNSNAARLPPQPVAPPSGRELIDRLQVEYDTDEWVDVPDIVEDLVADEELTLLGGHGGVGKSYLALQIACCVALGVGILGKSVPKARRVMYYSAEDGAKRITRRARRICREHGFDMDQLKRSFLVVDATEQQPLYGETIDQIESDDGKRTYFNKVMGSTADFGILQSMVQVFDPDLLIVDGASDTYDGNEITRRDVRAFIRMMQRVHPARRIGVLMLVHVDRSSARGNVTEDDGYSGSSQWHNAARRRLYLRPEAKTETLWLKVMKNQDGPPAPDIALRRIDGVLMPLVTYDPDAPNRKAARAETVLRLIGEYFERGQNIGTSLAPQATTGVFKSLKDDPAFPKDLDFDETCQIVRDAQRMGALVEEDYEYSRGKFRPRWKLKTTGTPPDEPAGSAQSDS